MDYVKIKDLDNGVYAKVICVQKADKFYAMKTPKEDDFDGITFDFIRETSILKSISSPYIISLLDIDYTNFQFIILPLYEYNLRDYIKKYPLSESSIRKIFRKISLGIHALHSSGVIHRDIKPSNIMIDRKDSKVVLIDNGLSKNINYSRKYGNKTPDMVTSLYRPPEIFLNYTEYSFEIDVWSAGVILAELYLKKHLFSYQSEIEILTAQAQLIGTTDLNLPFKIDDIDERIIEMHEGCLVKHFEHFGKDFLTLLNDMLQFNPKKRCLISDVLNSPYCLLDVKVLDTRITYENMLKTWISPYHFIWKPFTKHSLITTKSEITFNMRKILVSWMIDVCHHYNSHDSIYFSACVLLDHFLILSEIEKPEYQLLGMCCLLISSKLYSSSFYLSIDELIYMSANAYIEKQVIEMEKRILRVLQFNISFPNLFDSLSIYHDKLSMKYYNKIRKYLYIWTLYPNYLDYKSSILVGTCCIKAIGREFELNLDDNNRENNRDKNSENRELEESCKIFNLCLENYNSKTEQSIEDKFKHNSL